MVEKLGILYAEISLTTKKESVYLPANSFIHSIKVIVMAAFNDSGTDLLNIGTVTDPDHYVDDLSIAPTGAATVTLVNPGEIPSTNVPTQIDVEYTGQNSNATTGLARIMIEYVQK